MQTLQQRQIIANWMEDVFLEILYHFDYCLLIFFDIIKQHRLSLRIEQESIFRTQIIAELGPIFNHAQLVFLPKSTLVVTGRKAGASPCS